MLSDLKFVQGAVGKKDFIPAITHFCIENGTVRSYNGTIALCSPIACDLNIKPKAIPMVQAIGKCTEATAMSVLSNGRLHIKSGRFNTRIECIEESQSHVLPEGIEIPIDGAGLLNAIRAVQPFVGTDASRPWATGVLLRGQSAFATNNVCLVEAWVGGTPFPRVVNLPRACVAELVRIGQAPIRAQFHEHSVTFHYDNGRWLRTQLYSTDWPAAIHQILEGDSNPKPIPKEVFVALDQIRPFMNKLQQVFVSPKGVRTHFDHNDGASADVEWFTGENVYALDMVALLDGIADRADFTVNPARFFSDTLRGALNAMRMPEAPRPE